LLPSGGFEHRFHDSLTDLKNYFEYMDAQGHTMYYAQASFRTKENRKHENALFLRNFFLDIDCGEGKPFASQGIAIQELKRFCDETGFSFPSVVSSGNGLYAHWCISQDLPAEVWRTVAKQLKTLCEAYNFKADPSRTADCSSVLRPVGTTNRKNGNEKPVRLLIDRPAISFAEFSTQLKSALDKKKLPTKSLTPPSEYQGVPDEFVSGINETPVSYLTQLVERCAQIRQVRDSGGYVSEPLWYDFIGVARFTQEALEGEFQIIHEWSSGHPDYSPGQTTDKIQHHIDSGAGPTTCQRFGMDNPMGCIGCRWQGKVKSPISLGRPISEPVVVEKEDHNYCPEGFKRLATGLHRVSDGQVDPNPFYDSDLFITAVSKDLGSKQEMLTIQHKLPFNKEYEEFQIRSSLVRDPKAFHTALLDNHVHCIGTEARNDMTTYIESYMKDLRKKRDITILATQMGWQGDSIVLGSTVHQPEGDPVEVGFSANVPTVARSFASQGNVEEWSAITRVFDFPGIEDIAFSFLAGGFGSPLLRFTGFAGGMVAMIGRSGVGKTLTGEWMCSVYGDPDKLKLQNDDTRNAIVSRLGIYNSFPAYIDEISNIMPDELSNLLYRVTQGRDKARLTQKGAEKEGLNQWNLVAVASSNHSLMDKLSAFKINPTAEMNRVLEVRVVGNPKFLSVATQVRRIFYKNYGTAGPIYCEWLAKNQDRITQDLDKIIHDLKVRSGARGEHRFWLAMCAVAIYGGLVAKKLGLIQFDVKRIWEWSIGLIKENLGEIEEHKTSSFDIIGQFLDERQAGGLILTGNECEKQMFSIAREPRAPLEYRIELDNNKLFINRTIFRRWLQKQSAGYTDFKKELQDWKILLDHDGRKVLGSRTQWAHTQVAVWIIDISHPALQNTMRIVKKLATEEVKLEEVERRGRRRK
jgi:hypothetical protein